MISGRLQSFEALEAREKDAALVGTEA